MGQHKVKGASTEAYALRQAEKEAVKSLKVKAEFLDLVRAFFHKEDKKEITTKGHTRSKNERIARRKTHHDKMVCMKEVNHA